MELLGRVLFNTVDNELELNLGGDYDNFSFEVGGKTNTTESTLQFCLGVGSDEMQQAMFFSSNGSNHTSGMASDYCILLKKYVSSAWVTVLAVKFVEKTATGAIFDVVTANSDYYVVIKGSPAA